MSRRVAWGSSSGGRSHTSNRNFTSSFPFVEMGNEASRAPCLRGRVEYNDSCERPRDNKRISGGEYYRVSVCRLSFGLANGRIVNGIRYLSSIPRGVMGSRVIITKDRGSVIRRVKRDGRVTCDRGGPCACGSGRRPTRFVRIVPGDRFFGFYRCWRGNN